MRLRIQDTLFKMLTSIKSLLKKENNPTNSTIGFFRDSLVLASGTVLAQLIPLIAYPFLTRLYSPYDFGVFATVSSITVILSVVASGQYQSVILITDTDRNAVNLFWLVVFISTFSLLMIETVFLLSSDLIASFFGNPSLRLWVLLSPPTAFLIIVYASINEWFLKKKYLVSLSANRVINSSSTSILKVIYGNLKILNGGLILGELLGRVITASVISVIALRKHPKEYFIPNYKEMKSLAYRFISVPKYILPGQLMNSVGGEIPVLIMATVYDSTKIGFFTMAIYVLILPARLISLAVRDTFRKQAIDIFQKTGECYTFYKKILSVTAGISFTGFSVFFIIAPRMFSYVLGDEWVTAGEYARILVPIVAISFVSEIGSPMFIIAEKMRRLLLWQIINIALTITSIIIGILFYKDIRMTLLCFTIGRSIAHFTSIIMTIRIARGK
jgi:O-antigen/teichoic acid export membrane protein